MRARQVPGAIVKDRTLPSSLPADPRPSVVMVRWALVVVVAGIALTGAAFLATAHLTLHGHYHCDPRGAPAEFKCNPNYSYWVADRAAWQIPVAIVIAAVGVGAAVLLRRSKRPDPVE